MANDSSGGGIVGLIVVVVIYTVLSSLGSNIFLSRMWYSTVKDAAWDNVLVERKPPDCDWNHAPLGDKDCSYKRAVVEQMCRVSTQGRPIFSNDDGKTWNLVDANTACKASVYVGWTKVEGE
jgi:hypothetical protein